MVALRPRLSSTGAARLADGAEQVEVLHVARADLESRRRISPSSGDLIGGHHLGDDGQAGLSRALRPIFQAFFAQPLEGVGRGARFVGAAAQGVGPGFSHRLGNLQDLRPALHRARPGDDGDFGPPTGKSLSETDFRG